MCEIRSSASIISWRWEKFRFRISCHLWRLSFRQFSHSKKDEYYCMALIAWQRYQIFRFSSPLSFFQIPKLLLISSLIWLLVAVWNCFQARPTVGEDRTRIEENHESQQSFRVFRKKITNKLSHLRGMRKKSGSFSHENFFLHQWMNFYIQKREMWRCWSC